MEQLGLCVVPATPMEQLSLSMTPATRTGHGHDRNARWRGPPVHGREPEPSWKESNTRGNGGRHSRDAEPASGAARGGGRRDWSGKAAGTGAERDRYYFSPAPLFVKHPLRLGCRFAELDHIPI